MTPLKTWPGTSEVTSIASGTGINITGSVIPTVNISDTTVTPGSYTNAGFTVNAQGQLTAASNGVAPVTNVSNGTGITVAGTTTPTISLTNTAVTANTYGNPSSLTVNAQGQLTSVTAGTARGIAVLTTASTSPWTIPPHVTAIKATIIGGGGGGGGSKAIATAGAGGGAGATVIIYFTGLTSGSTIVFLVGTGGTGGTGNSTTPTAGNPGNSTTFNGITAAGGAGGTQGAAANPLGGAGGSATGGISSVNGISFAGGNGNTNTDGAGLSGAGGNSTLGGGGAASSPLNSTLISGVSGVANTGAGGGGGVIALNGGSGAAGIIIIEY